jgi:16S rRNA (guanine966-N2)-methyltransferase
MLKVNMHIIAGIYKNIILKTPKGDATRPTSSRLRESVFNICQNYIEESAFLDLFAGSGAMGFEALSRGAKSAFFIDKSKDAINCIEHNIAQLKVSEQTECRCGDVFSWVERLDKAGRQFDIIYADPPYETPYNKNSSESYGSHFLLMMDRLSLLKPGGTLFIEESSKGLHGNPELATLQLHSSREGGRSLLHEYKKIKL